MKPICFGFTLLLGAAVASAAAEPTALPPFTVYSGRVANQTPTGTIAMPVSALRYEPRVDLQGRNLVEGQADITIRGGTFENSGFRIGVLSLTDPQTGHYLAELPIAPVLLGAPEVLTGMGLAVTTTNATTGAISYGWREIRDGGAAQIGAGPHGLRRSEVYQGVRSDAGDWGADVALAHSESDGPIAFSDHRFRRANGRLQRATRTAQSDLVVGYQEKNFGWPNLYTPFNSFESENLQTLLLAANHRVALGGDDYVAIGAYYRRNKDDYAFNRFAPLPPVHPFQHTTWQQGVAAEGRRDLGGWALTARAEWLADELKSTSLRPGSRTLAKVAVVPEKSWTVGGGDMLTARAGLAYDDSNRRTGEFSPVFELGQTLAGGPVRYLHLGYTQTVQEPSYTASNASPGSGLFRGNPALRRTIARTLEAGGTVQAWGWMVDTAVFARHDHDLVDWTFRRGVTARTANAVNLDTAGFELVARRSWPRVDLVFGYTALTKDPDYRGAPVDASFYALNYARQRLTLAATVRVAPGVELRVDNAARRQAANALRTVGGDEAVLTTVALAWRPTAWRRVELTAQMDNVWNSRFQDIPAVPASPRTWSVGANYTW
ncbi:TonB-dependent receptor [Opitutus sp. ER46]|uniref:TonB-dependent receptor n=1 Tax=Opitutus sp. ER46 TaxID=2161864 RepID=UPI000D303535|nr:TonB-dependent receptor [Opitutus sp. ER46]PTX90856.1 TonB-dependent receptor [Opitutus sp. ER46]